MAPRPALGRGGFSLVELLITVVTLGIFVAVSVPNFRRYQARVKTGEARLQLAALFAAESAAQADHGTFATCIGDLGYNPSSRGHYAVGFGADNPALNASVRSKGGACADGGHRLAPAAVPSVGVVPRVSTADVSYATWVATAAAFDAGAVGRVSPDPSAGLDAWSIDQDKRIIHVSLGY